MLVAKMDDGSGATIEVNVDDNFLVISDEAQSIEYDFDSMEEIDWFISRLSEIKNNLKVAGQTI